MTGKRIEMYRLQDLVRLHRMNTGYREVARLLKMGTNTERDYREALEKAGLLMGDPRDLPELKELKAAIIKHLPPKQSPERFSTVEPWGEEIVDMIKKDAGATAIYDYLRLTYEEAFTGSLSAVKRFCRRKKKKEGIKPEDVVIPVETDPGEIAQVDFGYCGRLYDAFERRVRKAWVFVLVLGFSRHMFADIVFDQRTETWLRLHIKAFETLGGVVETVVPDNLKSAVVRAAFGADGPTALNRSFRELAKHFGFKVDPAPPRKPEKKGKVEAGVKYVKRSFFRPRDFVDVDDARYQLAQWVEKIAGQRKHGTTGRRPLELFEEKERGALLALPTNPFEMAVWKKAKVHADSHIAFEKRLYSVPWRHIGKEVWVRATASAVSVYLDEERIATHDRRGPGWRSTKDEHLPEHRSDYRHRNRSYWEERADKLGEPVGSYIREVFDSDDVLSKLRAVQGMVKHLESFPPERARRACERASYFGNHTLRGLKNILRRALDIEPLPDEQSEGCQVILHPRFARKASEFIPKKEKIK